ncbi:uncharacterized protein LOC127131994 [Lathyrus oleraceus]|uniref:Uncharacterized protein n=1 Tax=Pisum sativum TaxID=3888 RepID=A0A9D5B6Q6_PEA|nr:uncharacterized protein LOC127131994 [Pisum sativum]KAI5432380.1 hypothetical protein KIW84_036213 [Pisum sativum]
MASIFNILSITLFLALAFQAYGERCNLSNIEVKQTKTSGSAWNVTVTNNCICTQTEVKFNTKGFKSSTPVDPTIFSQDGLLIQGAPFYGFQSATFTYTSASQFKFAPISSLTECS